MKMSNKLLIGVSILLILLFTTALVLLKGEAKRVVKQYSLQTGLNRIETGAFHSVEIGPGYDVSVIGWASTAVSWDTSAKVKTKLENIDGTLRFSIEPDTTINQNELVELNIRVENIQSIKSMKGSKLSLIALSSDSLSVTLEDSQSLEMINCNIKYLEITDKDGLTITSTQSEDMM